MYSTQTFTNKKVGKPGRTNMVIMARTCLYGYQWIQQVHCYTCMSSYHLYSCLTSTLERQKWHIAITNVEATVLHGAAAHCHRVFYVMFLSVTICEFSLHISINYKENVMELLTQVNSRHSSPIFFERLGIMRLLNIMLKVDGRSQDYSKQNAFLHLPEQWLSKPSPVKMATTYLASSSVLYSSSLSDRASLSVIELEGGASAIISNTWNTEAASLSANGAQLSWYGVDRKACTK